METNWVTIWKLIFAGSLFIFAVLAVVVTIRGFGEVLELLRGKNEASGETDSST